MLWFNGAASTRTGAGAGRVTLSFDGGPGPVRRAIALSLREWVSQEPSWRDCHPEQ